MADTPVDFGILAGAGAPLREFKAGEVIFKQGDAASEFFVIHSGKVDIRLGNRLLGTVSDHDIFGEMALIDAAPRSAAPPRWRQPTSRLFRSARSSFCSWSAARRISRST
jgi:hypothetical protein